MKALRKFNIFNYIKNKINKSKEHRELKKQEKLYIESLNPQSKKEKVNSFFFRFYLL